MIYQLILVFSLISLATSDCPLPDRYIDGSCFTFVNIPMNFTEANDYCGWNAPNTWSNLALEENDIHAVWLARIAATTFSARNYWIGVYRPTVYDNFRSILRPYLTFQHFAQINPSMNYVAGRTSDGKWTTMPEEERLPFICSYKPVANIAILANTDNKSYMGWLKDFIYRRRH